VLSIICINDGSTDSTRQVLEEYQRKWCNIVVYNQENQGASSARNRGLALANGEYIAFIDGDDYYPEQDVLECLYKTAKREHMKICGGYIIEDKNGILKRKFVENTRKEYFYSSGKMLFSEYAYPMGFTRYIYSRKMLEEEHIVFPQVRVFEDPLFLVKAMIKAKEFYVLRKEVYSYRTNIHKREYSYTDSLNTLEIMYQMLQLAKTNHIVKLQISCISVFKRYFEEQIVFYYSPKDEKFVQLLNRISDSFLRETVESLPNDVKYFTPQGVEKFIWQSREEYLLFESAVQKNDNVIIYGAGKIGKFIYELMKSEYDKQPIGIAVTELDQSMQYFDDMAITNIRSWYSYQDSALFIVAVLGDVCKDMLDVLEEMCIKNIYVVDYYKLLYYVKKRGQEEKTEIGKNGK